MGRKDKLIALIHQGEQDLADLAASISPEQRAREGTAENWSIKDILGHMAHWQSVAVQDLDGVARQQVTDENIDSINASIFEERRHRSWDEMQAEFSVSSAELARLLAGLTEDDLASTDKFASQQGRPLWRQLLGDGYSHNLIHFTNWYAANGQRERGLALMQMGMGLVRDLDDSAEWQGTCSYNIACQYALSGDKESALPVLAEALRLNPRLTDWSRKDPDLASLRGEPAYLALYTDAPAA